MFLSDHTSYDQLMDGQRSSLANGLSGKGKWTREYSETIDGPYPANEKLEPQDIYDKIIKAIPLADAKFPIADKEKFARVLFSQIYAESSGQTCVFSGSGPAGATQFTRGTWAAIYKTMGWVVPPLTARCIPWYAILAQVCLMAQLLQSARKGGYQTALENYNTEPTKATYARNILKTADSNKYDFAALAANADPDGSIRNAMRVEYP